MSLLIVTLIYCSFYFCYNANKTTAYVIKSFITHSFTDCEYFVKQLPDYMKRTFLFSHLKLYIKAVIMLSYLKIRL